MNQEDFPTPPTTELAASPRRAQSNIQNTSPRESSLLGSPGSSQSYASGDAHSLDEFVVIPEHSSAGEDTVPDIAVSHSMDTESCNFLSFLEPFHGAITFDEDLILDTNLEPDSGATPFGPACQQPFELDFSLSQLLEEDNGEIEEIIRQSNNSASPWPLSFPEQDNAIFDFSRVPDQPPLPQESQEMLALRFDRLTCGILSVKDGKTENPWRTLIWPLAKETPALYHALFALSAFHSAKEDPSLRVQGVKHMRQSMTCLRQQIQNMRTDTALATSLALAFADTWDQNTRTCVQHLRGAKVLMQQVLTTGVQSGPNSDRLNRIRFLYNTWTYMDVIARLTSLDDSGPDDDLTPDIFHPPGDAVHEIDPLMGCAATLFPLIGRVARLVQRVRKCASNSVSIVAQGMELKSLVEQWEPPHWFEPPEDPTSEVQHSIQVAHAYRWATLLYLHQAVPEMPSEPAEELAKRVLILLATVPPSSRTTIIQMFPLLAAGAEVDDEDDRRWVMDRWFTIQSRLMLGGIDRCLDVVREVWGRRDKLNAQRQRDQENSSSSRAGSFSCESKANPNAGFGSLNGKTNGRAFHNRANSGAQQDVSMQGLPGLNNSKSAPSRRGSALSSLESIEFERTVRSRLHWVNVMGEWGWEGKIHPQSPTQ
ncbi:hypothetical protein N7466_010124 [Penicillium verhagenii]|uniref:uncharacterized protein n=1 Tax=Penicillium verhagenii TaxID=1562060 RepID=UPI0025453D67|nr:uncharacterized protein N7466_010124 [Penicillium verhagenii]KAJ5919181.1 hypothetical protein N7466_010124 [Penicillium verhagenii]